MKKLYCLCLKKYILYYLSSHLCMLAVTRNIYRQTTNTIWHEIKVCTNLSADMFSLAKVRKSSQEKMTKFEGYKSKKKKLRLPQTSNCSIKFQGNRLSVVRRSDFSEFRLKKIGANENQPVNKIQIVNTMPFFSSKCNFLRE